MAKSIDPKKTMLLHSEAKVTFYKKYLERYLRILDLSKNIREINIFDVFCGTWVYENNKKGSPIIAFDEIKKLKEEYSSDKKITLSVNDEKEAKVSAVQDYFERKNKGYCEIKYYNQPAELMFQEIISVIDSQDRVSRNLIFIDPYGYKEIKKETLQRLLKNRRTEIIVFLPIAQMQRFTTKALSSDLKPYEPLKKFVHSFFPSNHPIRVKKISAIDYISSVKEALRFKEYYSTSYFIERDNSNYYALFFISPSLFGFQKILEVKWQLDEEDGGGFKQPNLNRSLFDDEEKDLIKQDNYKRLEQILEDCLQSPKNNKEIYEIILMKEFLPKHATEIIRNWEKEKSNFKVVEFLNQKPARKNSFYINWENYKINEPRVIFTLEKL